MVIPKYNTEGTQVGDAELPSDIFEVAINVPLMHQALVRQQANARQGTHKAQSRSEVNRTKSKWYRQKGTGRARHGSRNANLFVGGGVAHGPNPHDYVKKMPRKMRRNALRSALSVKASEEKIVLVDALDMDVPKTKALLDTLKRLGLEDIGKEAASALVILPGRDEMVEKSARNVPYVKTLHASYLNIYDLLKYDYIVLTEGTVDVIEGILG